MFSTVVANEYYLLSVSSKVVLRGLPMFFCILKVFSLEKCIFKMLHILYVSQAVDVEFWAGQLTHTPISACYFQNVLILNAAVETGFTLWRRTHLADGRIAVKSHGGKTSYSCQQRLAWKGWWEVGNMLGMYSCQICAKEQAHPSGRCCQCDFYCSIIT